VTDPAHLEGLLVMVDEAEDMLLHGIVRGELNRERNTYEIKIKKEHAESMDKETITHMDPITAETSCNESEKPDMVVVTATKSSNRHEN
jgi:complex III assembly factor LYRM7